MNAREWKRVYGSHERVQWVKSRPCDVCGKKPTWRYPSDNAHVTNGGMGRKADARWIISACTGPGGCHHEMDHGIGKRALERKFDKNLKELARKVDREWQEHQDALAG